jgi:protein-tyrosine-phosphatase/biotin carboxylase
MWNRTGAGLDSGPQQDRVLVLDADMPHTLAIVRSLARRGLAVHVASHAAKPLAGYSRHAREVLHYPDPLTDEPAFLAWIGTVAHAGTYRLVIPVTERTAVPIHEQASLRGTGRFALPPAEALAVALDKERTLELASGLGVPIPYSTPVVSEADLTQALADIRYPVVVKPSRSIGTGREVRRQLSVEYAFGEQELRAKTRHFLAYGEVLLQQYVPGEGVGIELIANRGRIEYAFQHRRLHEIPLTGGGSCLRISVPVEPVLLDAAARLMAALAWHGVAMVEFKWNAADGSFALMEINGRFWGSLPLAVAAGADFPAMLYELLVDGAVGARPPARTGVVCRKLSSDIYWLEQVLRRDAPAGLVKFPSLGSVLRDLLLVFSPRHRFDVQQWRDPWPGVVDLARIGGAYLDRFAQRWRERRQFRAHRSAWRNGRAQRCLAGAKQVLFVCYGNINRSALAERSFQGLAPERGVAAISAGFHEEEGRPADPVMVDVAEKAGIGLHAWSSRRVTAEMVAASDVILVMEHRHFERLCEEFPAAAGKTFLLGMAAGGSCGKGEIDDPYGKDRAEYERCAREVTASVRGITNSLAGARAQGAQG